eukprot:TRINITY_DN26898_c0_g1_i1.p1 TRINITY_DN26898_c0_g1~~TRINITY_DN26898_c0_g1_i1.p1  ORF type:complete len:266 (-),score=66.93 TRINITY_DN26898_c0_g1_i1:527-1324(-)
MEGYDEQPLKLTLFDAFVEEYLVQEGFLNDFPNPEVAQRVTQQQKALERLEAVRRLLLSGRIADAIGRIGDIDPTLLSRHPQLAFRLHKQQFVEHLRDGDESSALEYCKRTFEPFALNSFPDAYAEFKRSMLMLIYGQDLEQSPVAHDWSAKHLDELAATVHATLLALVPNTECVLGLLLRYLLAVHRAYHQLHATATLFPEADDLLRGTAAAPLPREGPSSFVERDIQNLAQVGMTSGSGHLEAGCRRQPQAHGPSWPGRRCPA